jgi:hypothetical protein
MSSGLSHFLGQDPTPNDTTVEPLSSSLGAGFTDRSKDGRKLFSPASVYSTASTNGLREPLMKDISIPLLATLLILFSLFSLLMADPNLSPTGFSVNPQGAVSELELRYALKR